MPEVKIRFVCNGCGKPIIAPASMGGKREGNGGGRPRCAHGDSEPPSFAVDL